MLDKACAKMSSLSGVAFRSYEAQDDAMMRQFRGQMPDGMGGEDIEVRGEWCRGVTRALLNFEEDEIIRHGRRVAARGADDWTRRMDATAEGSPLPYIFDPELFFEIVASSGVEVSHSEPGKYKGDEVLIVGCTIEGDEAHELSLTGAFPRPKSGGGIIMMGGGMGGPPPSEVMIDIAFYIDPETSMVRRLRVMTYKENPFVGQVQIAVNGGGGGGDDDEEEEDVEEFDGDGKRLYKKGMPVRALGEKLSLADFDVSFSEHGKTFDVDVPKAIAKFLKLPKAR